MAKESNWSKTEIDILKMVYPVGGVARAQMSLKRSEIAIQKKASLLKLQAPDTDSKGKKRWTALEEDLLRNYYPIIGSALIIEKNILPGRDLGSISNKAEGMGIKFEGESRVDQRMLDTARTMLEQKILNFVKGKSKTLLEICEHIDKAPNTVKQILEDLGKAHYNISLKEEDQTVRLHTDPVQGGKIVIDVEKYFGSAREVTFGVISDMHYSNVHSREELIQLQYEIFQKEGVTTVFHCGNMIDGELYFNRYELLAHGVDGQIQYLIKHAPCMKGITTYFVTGDDHEGWMAHNVGLNIGKKIQSDMEEVGRQDWKYLGFLEADVGFKTNEGESVVRLAHPGGGTAYALSYTPQKIVESLAGGTKPHLFLSGHYHKLGYWFIRNVHTFLTGCMEDQTTFMRKKHIEAHLGAWIVRMTLAPNGTILKLQPTAYPYFDKKVYDINKDFNMPGLQLAETVKAEHRVF